MEDDAFDKALIVRKSVLASFTRAGQDTLRRVWKHLNMQLFVQSADYDSDDEIDDFDEDFIRGVLSDEDFEFAILAKSESKYIQCAITGSSNQYVLEYQDGSVKKHFQTDNFVTLSRAISAFIWYLRGDPSWKTEFVWERIAI